MRFRTLTAILLACAATAFAQDRMSDTLRNGIMEEDSKLNPRAAIQEYRAVMTQFDESRKTAATALFRMAECFRKVGNRGGAISSYQRILKDFADQTKLAAQSRTILTTTYNLAAVASPDTKDQGGRAGFDNLMRGIQQEQAKTAAARAKYRSTIENEMQLVRKQLSVADDRYKAGLESEDVGNGLKIKLAQLERDLAAFDAGITAAPVR